METKTCKVCGRELPLTSYRRTRSGNLTETCNECINEKRAESRYRRAQIGGARPLLFQIRTSTDRPSATHGVRCAGRRSGSKAVGVR